MRDQLCYALLQQAALKTHLAVATHSSVTLQRHILMRLYVMRDVAYAMPDSVPHLSVSSMVWKSARVQSRKNFVICVVKRKGERVLQQPSCLRYKANDCKNGIVLCLSVSVFLRGILFLHSTPQVVSPLVSTSSMFNGQLSLMAIASVTLKWCSLNLQFYLICQ